ncbi:MAG TPA: cupredoxin domain-containing protein [bacterium]|nr:cupredoxin domain-containing protein [bacterium]
MRRGLLVFGILTLALAALAEVHEVSIGDNLFSPAIVTVSPGDRVRWTNDGAHTHRTKSVDGLWDSGFLDPGETYTRTFNTSGSFDYNDPQYPYATGTVIVEPSGVAMTSWGVILSLYR